MIRIEILIEHMLGGAPRMVCSHLPQNDETNLNLANLKIILPPVEKKQTKPYISLSFV